MSTLQQDQGLDTLRHRATCTICYEFYNKPKRLSCSHSLCLLCLQGHFQLNGHKNFPPCPMCRKPIAVLRTKLETLEPDIAVQDIVDFVKQYELCGLCNKKTNPKLKCDECSVFVCDSCDVCHTTLKPSHILTSILPSSNCRKIPTKHTCKDHADQSLDLFCIICRRVLCVHCKEYSHAKCELNKGIELELYRRGFLNHFVQSNDDSKIKLEKEILSRVVYIPAFAREAKLWIKAVQMEVRECNNYFRGLRGRLMDIENTCKSPSFGFALRCPAQYQDIDTILNFGESCVESFEKLLNDETSETDVTLAMEGAEKDSLTVFKYRRAFPLDMEPLTLFERNTIPKLNFEQVSNSSIKVCALLKCQFVHNMTYNAAPLYYMSQSMNRSEVARNIPNERTEIEGVQNVDISGFSTLSTVCIGDMLSQGVLFRRYSNLFARNSDDISYKQSASHFTAFDVANNMYINNFLEQSELRKESTLEIQFINVDIGYSELHCDCKCKFEVHDKVPEKPQVLIFNKSLESCIMTQFVNVAVLPCRPIEALDKLHHGEERGNPYLFSFIGNRESGAGLESVFLYIDSNKDIKYGLSVCSTLAKFKSPVPVYLNDPKRIVHKSSPGVSIINDTNGAFHVNIRREADSYWMSYSSLSTFDSVPEDFIRVIGGIDRDPPESSRSLILWRVKIRDFPATKVKMHYLKVTLLCNLESGIYFVRCNDLGELEIGKLAFSNTTVTENIMLTVKSSDTDIPLGKLRPLTMVQRRNKGILVVCSVKEDNGHFVMILTDKRGPEAVELLTIDYAASKITVVEAWKAHLSGSRMTEDIAESKSPEDTEATIPYEPLIPRDGAISEIGATGDKKTTCTTRERLIQRQSSIRGETATLDDAMVYQVEAGNVSKSTDGDTTDDVLQMTNPTSAAVLKAMDTRSMNGTYGPVTESCLQEISEATVEDLEMDQDGNIVFLLKRKGCECYSVCTKYVMPQI